MGVDRLKEAKRLEREKSNSPEAPRPEPYPAQGGLTAPMRQAALAENDVQRLVAWAGQSAALARPEPAADFVGRSPSALALKLVGMARVIVLSFN